MKQSFKTIKVLGTINNTLYVIGHYGKSGVAVFSAIGNAEFAQYSSIEGWSFTIAHDTLTEETL